MNSRGIARSRIQYGWESDDETGQKRGPKAMVMSIGADERRALRDTGTRPLNPQGIAANGVVDGSDGVGNHTSRWTSNFFPSS